MTDKSFSEFKRDSVVIQDDACIEMGEGEFASFSTLKALWRCEKQEKNRRRFEAAKEAMGALIFPMNQLSGGISPEQIAEFAIKYADALLKGLEE